MEPLIMQTLPLSGTDIVVQSKDGDLLAVVEIRNPIDLHPEYAATIRKTCLSTVDSTAQHVSF